MSSELTGLNPGQNIVEPTAIAVRSSLPGGPAGAPPAAVETASECELPMGPWTGMC